MNHKEIDLNTVIASQEKLLRRALGAGISFAYQAAPTPACLRGDEGMLAQVLAGLMEQARQNLPGGGGVWMQTEQVEVDDIHSRIHPDARRGEFVRLTVRDNGPGLRAEALQKLLEQCPPPNAPRLGQALPLPLLVGMIKRREGWIEASSHTGGGTSIAVYFPVANPAHAALMRMPRSAETILLVDDEVAIRSMVKGVLERASYEVVEADTGVRALAIWEEHKARVNLLLTDMVMPDGLSGRGLAQRLRAGKPELKVIYTSGFDLDGEAQRDTVEAGVQFLQKPYDMRRLLETVHAAMVNAVRVKPPLPISQSV